MNLAIIQSRVVESKENNLIKMRELADELKARETDLLVLPEMFNCPYEEKRFRDYAENIPGRTTEFLSDLAVDLNAYVVGGSIPELDGRSVYNTSPVFDPGGNIMGIHRKVHLFDVDYPGRIKFKESDYLSPGDSATVLETSFAKIGVAICYDLRFPELLRRMTLQGSKMLVIPAAFNTTTGPAHWLPLLRTRAIDNQTFVVACSPARNLSSSYHAYGHSMVIDPWGKVLVEAGESEEHLTVSIDLEKVGEIRKRLPILESRRPELY